jgi:hypothetical protein
MLHFAPYGETSIAQSRFLILSVLVPEMQLLQPRTRTHAHRRQASLLLAVCQE